MVSASAPGLGLKSRSPHLLQTEGTCATLTSCQPSYCVNDLSLDRELAGVAATRRPGSQEWGVVSLIFADSSCSSLTDKKLNYGHHAFEVGGIHSGLCGMQVKADVRMIKSEQFATDWSLRFPRIQRLREDKSASEVQTHEDFKAMVQQNRGTTTGHALIRYEFWTD